jgi:glucose/arabinose dehydrogenase
VKTRIAALLALACAALAVASGCGGGGGGGSSNAPPPLGATPTPTPLPGSATLSVAVGAAPAQATFGPIGLGALGAASGTITIPGTSANANLTVTVGSTLPAGVSAPSDVRRRPAKIGAQGIVAIAYVQITGSANVPLASTPSLALLFAQSVQALAPYAYVAQYAAGAWTTIETGAANGAGTQLTFSGGPAQTFGPAATTFVIFSVPSALPTPSPSPVPSSNPTGIPTTAPSTSPTLGPTAAPLPIALTFNSGGVYGETIATGLVAPRQLVALPNGDLLVGSNDLGGKVYIVPNADGAGAANAPKTFLTIPSPAQQGTAQGIAIDAGANNVYIATNQSVWKVPYHSGDQSEPTPSVEVAKVRRGVIAPNSDGDVHYTSSVAVLGTTLYVGVGSSCNACVESDPTRGTIQKVDLTTLAMSTKAARFRNALALTVNPATQTLWAGGAGQDVLLKLNGSVVVGVSSPLEGHPYEFFDPVTAHTEAVPDYGWPDCEENNRVYNPLGKPNATCDSTTTANTKVVVPAVAFYAYSTMIGATFYPANQTGKYLLPASYRGGAFLSMHGSWHENANGIPLAVPEVVFVPMNGDRPVLMADWSNSGAQWQSFLYGFQDTTNGTRIGRPVGLAVGPQGSLFIADDYAGVIYRIRAGTGPSSRRRIAR